MNSKQRQQLVESYSREHGGPPQAPIPERHACGHSNEPASRLGLMLKCAAGVAVVALLVVIGSGEDKAGMGKDARSNAARTATVTQSSSAAADRKEVFDARRARFEGNDPIPGKRYAAAVAPPDSANSKGIADATCSGGVDGGMDASGSKCGKGTAAAAH